MEIEVGDSVCPGRGISEGKEVGISEERSEGTVVGIELMGIVGDSVAIEGFSVACAVGVGVASATGILDGGNVGSGVGLLVGEGVRGLVGVLVGVVVGFLVGVVVGFSVGGNDGVSVESCDGDVVGVGVSARDGIVVVAMDGEFVTVEGDEVVDATGGGGATGDIDAKSVGDGEKVVCLHQICLAQKNVEKRTDWDIGEFLTQHKWWKKQYI